MNIQMSFSIQGEFITNLARKRYYQDNNLEGAIDLLKSCLVTDELSDSELTNLCYMILDGKAKIVGTYPRDDYRVEETCDEELRMIEVHSSDSSDEYGWLAPDGTYYPVPWSHHMEWAVNYLDEHFPFSENGSVYWRTDANGKRHHMTGSDVLVYNMHWVLIDNPHQGKGYPTYDTSRELTKSQKEFLFDYFIKRNRDGEAIALYKED